MAEKGRFEAGPNDEGVRIDRLLRKLLRDVPLSHIYRMIRTGRVRVNGRRVKTGYRVSSGDEIRLPEREGNEADRPSSRTTPAPKGTARDATAAVGIDIVYEDDHLLVVNKSRGVVTHGTDSLEERVRAYLADRLPADLGFRPGPLHRLDRNTTGAVAFSKSIHGARAFSEILRRGALAKVYLAVLTGAAVESHRWDYPIARREGKSRSEADAEGQPARTWVFPVQSVEVEGGRPARREAGGSAHGGPRSGAGGGSRSGAGGGPRSGAGGGPRSGAPFPQGHYTLAVLRIGTGRTHQIRVHAATAGLPVVGDSKYGGASVQGGMLLHAWMMAFDDPSEVLGTRQIEAPLPPDTAERIRVVFGGKALSDARETAQRAAAW